MNKLTYLGIGLLCGAAHLYAHDNADNIWGGSRPDGHAPIGVMGDHAHKTGEWMLSYRYMQMDMKGNLDGSDDISIADIQAPPATLDNFVVAPTEMTMDMHMFGIMYAPSDTLTLMAMVPFKRIEMEHSIATVPPTVAAGLAGETFTTETEGLGDISISGIYTWKNWKKQKLLINFGVSLPTGSIDEKDVAFIPPPNGPALAETVLPYPMQLGSGTYDLLPGLTYLGQSDDYSWGGQLKAKLRLGENEEDYRLGHEFEGTAWLAKPINDSVSVSLRALYKRWGDIHGEDSRLTKSVPMLGVSTVPTAQPDLRAGQRLDVFAGVNIYTKAGPGKSQRIALEVGIPAYQKLDGPQLETDMTLTLGWQMAF